MTQVTKRIGAIITSLAPAVESVGPAPSQPSRMQTWALKAAQALPPPSLELQEKGEQLF